MFVKVCGLRTGADVDAAVEAGADAVGFVLTDSVRRVTPERAGRLVCGVPDRVLTVGVFTDEPLDLIVDAAHRAGVRAIQLHGVHPPGRFAALRRTGHTLIRATSAAAAPRAASGDHGEDLMILDSPCPGSGRGWDWSRLGTYERGRWLLAGGLDPGNVAAAIAVAKPWGVDVSSGVEARRGIKDPRRIAEFVTAARGAYPRTAGSDVSPRMSRLGR